MGAAEVFVEAGGTVGSTGLGSGRGARGERWAARGLRPTAGCSLDLHSLPLSPSWAAPGAVPWQSEGESEGLRVFAPLLTPSQTCRQSHLSVSKLKCAF